MSSFETAFARYTAARRSAGAADWPGPADETDLAGLQNAVAPLVVPDQMLALWRHSGEGPDWLIDAGDLVGPRIALEMWQELNGPDSLPFAPTLLPIAFASHVYLAVELGYPGKTRGGALLRVPFEEIEPVAPDMATALDLVASAIEEGQVRWTGTRWGGADIEDAQRAMAATCSWPNHLASIGSTNASLPLTWPSPWQVAAGLDPADAEPRGGTATVATAEHALPGTRLRIVGRVSRLVGSGAGTHLILADDTGSLPCWCSINTDPFAVIRKGRVIEVDLVIQDADAVAAEGDPGLTLTHAPEGRYVAITIRLAGSG